MEKVIVVVVVVVVVLVVVVALDIENGSRIDQRGNRWAVHASKES